jgi:hypothetical protein
MAANSCCRNGHKTERTKASTTTDRRLDHIISEQLTSVQIDSQNEDHIKY